jgi:RNA polymerase sigma-70 factor (ECF subfamily)
MDEAQLEVALEEAKTGSRAAFGHIYNQFSRRVFGLCRKMLGSQAEAEDATAEVFQRAHRALDHYDRDRPFDRWILSIASRHCLNRLRRGRIEKRLFLDEPSETAAAPASASPLVACEDREQRRALLQAIDALPESYRVPLVLRYYGDLSYDEIAEQLDTTRSNVAVLLHRGKTELRRRIADSRVESP